MIFVGWALKNESLRLYVNAIPHNGDTGYVFEVDFNYPVTLHESHCVYSLAQESFKIEPEMLYSYLKELLNKLEML